MIIDNEGYLPMTRNLENALIDLHNSLVRPKLFFIDQVCIDQNDNAEKSVQVARMGDVYKYADQVVTYLGPEEAEDDDALDLLERIGHHFGDWYDNLDDDNDFDMLDRYARRKDVPNELKDFELNGADESALIHLEHIVYDAGWTQRLWMVQENLLNQDVVFLRGERTINGRLIHILPFCQSFGLLPKPKYINPSDLRQALVVADAYRDFFSKKRGQSFLKLVNDFGTTMGCSNPRDKIYALMGLAEETWGVEPDYDLDNLEVYMDFVMKSIESTKTLDIFGSFHDEYPKPDTSKECWPSWVPTFNKVDSPTIRGRAAGSTIPIVKKDDLLLKVKG